MSDKLFNALKAIETLVSGAMKIYGLPSGQGRRNDTFLPCGSGHIIPAVQSLPLGQSINIHSALSLGYYYLNRIRHVFDLDINALHRMRTHKIQCIRNVTAYMLFRVLVREIQKWFYSCERPSIVYSCIYENYFCFSLFCLKMTRRPYLETKMVKHYFQIFVHFW